MVARAPKAQKLGPGELTLTLPDSPLDLSCQMTKVEITWDVDEDDPVPVLCGGIMPGDTVYSAKLEGEAYQDLSAGGIIDYTWLNRGKTADLIFTPTAGAAKVTGQVVIRPLNIGGDVGKKNTTDIEFMFVGEPDFTPLAADTAGELDTE